jgi:hypothetical protein
MDGGTDDFSHAELLPGNAGKMPFAGGDSPQSLLPSSIETQT